MTETTQSALSALRYLRPSDRASATSILDAWGRRDEIDVPRVVDYYFAGDSPVSTPEVVEAAVEALNRFAPESRESAADMLLFWRRRAELTPATTAQVLDRLFPATDPINVEKPAVPEGYVSGYLDAIAAASRLYTAKRESAPKLTDPPACPSWCDGAHASEDDSDEFRDCTSQEILLPVRTDLGTRTTVFGVSAVRTFDKKAGKLSRPLVQMEDHNLTPREARALAAELARVADLIDGDAQ